MLTRPLVRGRLVQARFVWRQTRTARHLSFLLAIAFLGKNVRFQCCNQRYEAIGLLRWLLAKAGRRIRAARDTEAAISPSKAERFKSRCCGRGVDALTK